MGGYQFIHLLKRNLKIFIWLHYANVMESYVIILHGIKLVEWN